jgi:hypothetical protein
MLFWLSKRVLLNNPKVVFFYKQKSRPRKSFFFILALHLCLKQRMWSFKRDSYGMSKTISSENVAPQILIVLFLIYLFDNIIQLISLRNLWYYGGW